MKYLEIAGNRKRSDEWDNIRDIPIRGSIQHDMRIVPIPFIEESTYDGAYSEHFLEHLTREEGIGYLKEMYRVLKPGGVIRLVWPSMDLVEKIRSGQSQEVAQLYYSTFMQRTRSNKSINEQVADRILHQEGEHKYLWYVNELIDCLSEIGFNDVNEMPYSISSIEGLSNIDRHSYETHTNYYKIRVGHSSIVEAVK